MSILNKVNSPKDLKGMNIDELELLSEELRHEIITTVNHTGGHLASALGVIELTVAIHHMFDAPNDKIIFDVGHQSYAHKLLTGRKESFKKLRQFDGEHAFTRSTASEYDSFISGHSSTSLSVAAGFMRARELSGEDYNIVTVIGDGALSGGMTHEALNDSGNISGKQIILLNDNTMSINKSVGSIADYLARMHTRKWYNRLKNCTQKKLSKPKKPKHRTLNFLRNLRNSFKYLLQGGLPFDEYNLKYFGPVDGHNIPQLIKYLNIAKNEDKSVIIHIVTVKGNGYPVAECNPNKYHGLSAEDEISPDWTFSSQAGKTLCELARSDNKVIAVTAAMCSGTGLNCFLREFPNRFYDVGIAEAHAVTMCAGLASQGYKPYFAVYSTFLQRGFDQIIHDVCIEEQNVTFLVDRSGIVGPDGETHQGIFDISYLSLIPNLTIVSPMDTNELHQVIKWSLTYTKPLAIRYPRGGKTYPSISVEPIELGKWNYIKKGNINIVIIATGADMVANAIQAAEEKDITIINARFIKPLDEDMLLSIKDKLIITVEDNVINGGLYSQIASFYSVNHVNAYIIPYCIKDTFVPQGTKEQLFKLCNLDPISILKSVEQCESINT